MPDIPMYRERSTPTTQIPVSQVSGEPAAAIGRAVQGLGAQVFEMGREAMAEKNKLRDKADVADYEVMRQNFVTELEQKKNDAMIKDGVGYQDVYDKVVVPEMSKFQQKISSRNYSKRSIDGIMQRWELDSAGIAQSEVVKREKMELLDYTNRIQKQADSVLSTGDFESADEIYDGLANIVGQKEVDNMKSLGRYNYYTAGMQSLEEQRIDGQMDDKQYFGALENIREEVKASGMEINHQKSVEISVNSKILNFKGSRIKQRDTALKDFKKLRDRDAVTVEDIENIEKAAGKEWADALRSTIDSAISVQATSDDGADKIYQAVKSYQNGDISAETALKRASKSRGQYSEMGVYLIGRIAEEQAANNGVVVAYDNNWNGVPSKVTSSTTDFVDNLGFYMGYQQSGKRAQYFAEKFKQYDKWRDNNPEASEEDYITWRKEVFKKDSDDFISQKRAPQQQAKQTGTAPQSAIDYLKSNPQLKDQFKAKYGYVPEDI